MHAVCHATSNLKFGSCTALSSSSPVIEASKLVTVEVENWSQTPLVGLLDDGEQSVASAIVKSHEI